MKIYDTNKVKSEGTLKILLDDLPLSVKTEGIAHLIEGKEDVEEFPFSRFDNLVYINRILIENIKLEDGFITGDISFNVINNSRYRRRDLQNIDLSKYNQYRILFKPSFECSLNESKEVIPEKFHNFQVYLIEKSKFREDRLAKLLEI